jgi:hypothetical protein
MFCLCLYGLLFAIVAHWQGKATKYNQPKISLKKFRIASQERRSALA